MPKTLRLAAVRTDAFELRQRALAAMEAVGDLLDYAASNKIRVKHFSLDDDVPDMIRRLSAESKSNVSVDRAAELLRGAYLLAVAAAHCAIGRDDDKHRALSAVSRIFKIPATPELESLCAYAERATAYAEGYLQSVLDVRKATGLRGAAGKKKSAQELREKVRRLAPRLMHLSKPIAAVELTRDVEREPGTIEKWLSEFFPGDEWKPSSEGDPQP